MRKNIIKDYRDKYYIYKTEDFNIDEFKIRALYVKYKEYDEYEICCWDNAIIYQVFINYSWHYVYRSCVYGNKSSLTNVSSNNLLLINYLYKGNDYCFRLSKICDIKEGTYNIVGILKKGMGIF